MSIKLARRNLLLYLFQYGTRFLSPVIVAPYLAKTLGTSAFADYVVWNSVVWTSVLLMEFGFYLYAINATASASSRQDLGGVVSGIVTAKLMLTPVAILAFVTGMYAIGFLARQPVAVLAGVWAVFVYGMTFGWYFQGLQRGVTLLVLEAVPQFSQLLLVLLVVNAPEQMWLVTFLQTLAGTMTTALGWVLLRRDHLALRIDWPSAVLSLRSAFPYFVERASYTLYSTAAPILISILSTSHEAAFYGLAEKVNTLLTALVLAATPALTPVIARHLRQPRPDWYLSIKVVVAVTATTLVGATFLALLIGPLINRFLGEAYAGAIPVARCFCLVAVLMTFQICLSNFIVLPGGRAKLLVQTSAVALIVTFGFQAILIERYGALGSAVARAFGELSIGLALSAAALRLVRKPHLKG